METLRQRLAECEGLCEPQVKSEWLAEFHARVHSHPTAVALLPSEAVRRGGSEWVCWSPLAEENLERVHL